jgi:hypothetical protein
MVFGVVLMMAVLMALSLNFVVMPVVVVLVMVMPFLVVPVIAVLFVLAHPILASRSMVLLALHNFCFT